MGDWISASIYLRIPSLRRYETRERLPPSRYCAVPPRRGRVAMAGDISHRPFSSQVLSLVRLRPGFVEDIRTE
jgi:hypothetical protein